MKLKEKCKIHFHRLALDSFKVLNLSCQELDEEDCKEISRGMEEKKHFKRIVLNNCRINEKGLKVLCRAIGKNIYLREVELSGISIQEESFTFLFESLHKLTFLEKLNLSKLNFKEKGTLLLSELIESNHLNLKEINLSSCKFVKSVDQKIVDSLKNNNTLQVVDLSYVKFSKEEQLKLSEMLRENKNLKKVFLYKFTENLIADAIIKNKILEVFSFYFTKSTKKKIFEILKENKTLKELIVLNGKYSNLELLQLCKILETNKTLRKFEFNLDYNFPSETFNQICASLKSNLTLNTLRFGNELKNEQLPYILDFLDEKSLIKELNINIKKLGIEETKLFFNLLKKNKRIEKIDFSKNYISSSQFKFFTEFLEQSSSLQVLNLCECDDLFEDEEFRIEIVSQLFESLKKNKSLRELNLSDNILYEYDEQTNLLCHYVRSNSPLKNLNLIGTGFKLHSLQLLYDSLKFNFNLTKIDLFEYDLLNSESFLSTICKIGFILSSNKSWKPQSHLYFQKDFKQSVFSLLLCLKEKEKFLFFKFGKYIMFEIIKNIDRRSFDPQPQESKKRKRIEDRN